MKVATDLNTAVTAQNSMALATLTAILAGAMGMAAPAVAAPGRIGGISPAFNFGSGGERFHGIYHCVRWRRFERIGLYGSDSRSKSDGDGVGRRRWRLGWRRGYDLGGHSDVELCGERRTGIAREDPRRRATGNTESIVRHSGDAEGFQGRQLGRNHSDSGAVHNGRGRQRYRGHGRSGRATNYGGKITVRTERSARQWARAG